MNPERASVPVRPLAALKALEPVDKKGCPRLVHAKAHAAVLLEEVDVALVDLRLLGSPADHCLFHRTAEFLKRILRLQSLA